MKNLIQNPFRLPDANGQPIHFWQSGIHYDNLLLHGYRTSTVTLQDTSTTAAAVESYNLPISCRGQHAIRWGYIMRAVEFHNVMLLASFYDAQGAHLTTMKHPVSNLKSQFSSVMTTFQIPENADTVRLSVEFHGNTVACTYFAPWAAFVASPSLPVQ